MPLRSIHGGHRGLWRIVAYYVKRTVVRLALSSLKALSRDETKTKCHHRYVTVFIDFDGKDKPVVFALPGKGKDTVRRFKEFFVCSWRQTGKSD